MTNLLIISQLIDYLEGTLVHYSLSKGFNLGIGFSRLIKTHYLTTGPSCEYNLDNRQINLVNVSDLTEDYLKGIDIILFAKEVEMFDILAQLDPLRNLVLSSNRKQKIVVKSDSLAWIDVRRDKAEKKIGIKAKEYFNKYVDLAYVQTVELRNADCERFLKYDQRLWNKIFISPMGVNNVLPEDNRPNPYLQILPKTFEKTERKKIVIFYCGRLMVRSVPQLMKEIMSKLGDDFILHIFPGSFCLPPEIVGETEAKIKYSGKHHYNILCEKVFNDCKNILVHPPFGEKDKILYMSHADIAIDFSPSRPYNVKAAPGNAKLLEYCYCGMKVVGEENINNSHLVVNGKNGILLPGIATADEYVVAIKELLTRDIDKKYAQLQTIKTNNWDTISEQILNDIKTL